MGARSPDGGLELFLCCTRPNGDPPDRSAHGHGIVNKPTQAAKTSGKPSRPHGRADPHTLLGARDHRVGAVPQPQRHPVRSPRRVRRQGADVRRQPTPEVPHLRDGHPVGSSPVAWTRARSTARATTPLPCTNGRTAATSACTTDATTSPDTPGDPTTCSISVTPASRAITSPAPGAAPT